jgi:hypothetical protein
MSLQPYSWSNLEYSTRNLLLLMFYTSDVLGIAIFGGDVLNI